MLAFHALVGGQSPDAHFSSIAVTISAIYCPPSRIGYW
jgi:hypothetical protein